MKKIVYRDVAPNAKENFTHAITGGTAYSDPTLLSDEGFIQQPYNNPCELYSVLLDEPTQYYPDNPSGLFAFASEVVSDDSGNIGTITLTATATGQYTSQGITIVFDTLHNVYPTEGAVTWYRGDTVLATKEYAINSASYFFEQLVESYDKIVVTLSHLNTPHNRLRINEFVFGTIRTFGDRECVDISIIQEVYPLNIRHDGTSPTISTNVADIVLRPFVAAPFIFQKKQVFEIYHDDTLVATTLVDNYVQTGEKEYEIDTEDYVGAVLEKVDFMGGVYSNKNAIELITEICNIADVPFAVGDALAAETVSGYLPIMSCRQAIAHVCFAINAVVNTAYSGVLEIYRASGMVTRENSLDGTFEHVVTTEDRLTEVQVEYYAFTDGDLSYINLYQGSAGENILVEFRQPIVSLNIIRGEVVAYGDNFAVINAQDECILQGKPYTETAAIYSIKNPLLLAGELQNIRKVSGAKLVNEGNVAAISQRCYDYFVKTAAFDGRIVVDGDIVGDKIKQATKFSGEFEGVIEEMRYTLNAGRLVSEVVIR